MELSTAGQAQLATEGRKLSMLGVIRTIAKQHNQEIGALFMNHLADQMIDLVDSMYAQGHRDGGNAAFRIMHEAIKHQQPINEDFV